MIGHLEVFQTPKIDENRLKDLLEKYYSSHFLISDGIMIDFRGWNFNTKIQRILTVYQLKRILMEADDMPFIISVAAEIVNSWPVKDIVSLSEIMQIKSYYRGCDIYFNVVGNYNFYNFILRPVR